MKKLFVDYIEIDSCLKLYNSINKTLILNEEI